MNTLQWDKRSWLLSLGGGSLCGLICAVCSYPPTEFVLNGAVPYSYHGWQFADSMDRVFGAVGLLLLPLFLCVTTPRRYFLYAFIAFVLTCLWMLAEVVLWHKHDGLARYRQALLMSGAQLLTQFLMVCGPVSLYRWTQRRKRERLLALQQAMQDAADAVPTEGVWPAPPRRNIPPAG